MFWGGIGTLEMFCRKKVRTMTGLEEIQSDSKSKSSEVIPQLGTRSRGVASPPFSPPSNSLTSTPFHTRSSCCIAFCVHYVWCNLSMSIQLLLYKPLRERKLWNYFPLSQSSCCFDLWVISPGKSMHLIYLSIVDGAALNNSDSPK